MKTVSSSPLVSICCITYNHVAYIEDALKGFLLQETDFDYEILIHDDCSSDGTIEVLKHYEKLHPEKIHVFYEEENQHGKGKYQGGYVRGLLVPNAKGKYIALCEGDDYWIEPKKLQIQIDYLEAHPDCSEVCHSAIVLDGSTGVKLGIMGMGEQEIDLTTSDIIKMWGIPTASRVSRKKDACEYVEKWHINGPVGDYPTAIYSSTKGSVHHFPQVMSAYRFRAPGSWTSEMRDWDALLHNEIAWLAMLEKLDCVTNRSNHADFIEAAKAHLRLVMVQRGLSYQDGRLAREAKASFSAAEWAKVIAKRCLWLWGYSTEVEGWGKQSRRKLVKIH